MNIEAAGPSHEPQPTYAQRIRALLDQRAPNEEQATREGYRRLASAVFGNRYTFPDTQEVAEGLKQAFNELFLENTVDLPPSGRRRNWIRNALSPYEVAVLIRRYGLETGEPKSLREMAQLPEFQFNSPTRASQLEKKALKKLRYPTRAKKLIILADTE